MGSIIEKIGSFDIKKCTIFSLIVAIIYIIVEILTSEYIDIQSIISSNIFVLGLIIYFFLILIKLKLKKGKIKAASCVLIFSYNNIKYYYDFEDNDNVIIVTKVKNRYYYTIGMQSDFAALITKEELSGLLCSSY